MPAIPSPRAGRKPRLEIIPFIDIMFFLLATFMMVSLTMIENQGMELNLPKAGTSKPQDLPPDSHTISVGKAGEVYYNKELSSLEMIDARLAQLAKEDPDARLILQGDYDCPYGLVVEVFDKARQKGLTKLVIRTQRPSP